MTIKEFSKLCNCSTQTLRYYDSIDLLKPMNVDPFTGYRHYDKMQALDFIKIKNLQDATFTIAEIKELLNKSNEEICRAFDAKISEQETLLGKIKTLQRSYQNEYMQMQETLKEIQAKVIAASKEYDPQEEFGISQDYYEQLVAATIDYFENAIHNMPTDIDFSQYKTTDSNPEEEEEYLNPLQNERYTTIYEKHGWNFTKQALADIPSLDGEYLFHFAVKKERLTNISFCNTVLGIALAQNQGKNLTLGCNCTESKDHQNHFWLLKAK